MRLIATVDCAWSIVHTPPKIQLEKRGRWFEIESVSQSSSIVINDATLQQFLDERNCEYFDALKFPKSPSISFPINDSHNLSKCNISAGSTSFEEFSNLTCRSYTIYNGFSNDSLPQCSIIELPVINNEASNDLFTQLSAKFSIQAAVSLECASCHFSRKGICESDNEGKFLCANATEPSKSKGDKVLLLKLGLVLGIGGLIMIIMFFVARILCRGCCQKKRRDYQNIEAFLNNCGSLAPKRYSYSDIKKMTNSLKNKLGEGGYGCVYEGKLLDGQKVAVKILYDSKGNGEEFINEVASTSRTSHINIVTLLGFCFNGCKRALVYEFVPNGSLEKFIYEKEGLDSSRALNWDTIYQIALGIARGLEYLHRLCNTRILHFDIKPHNILLDENFCPKISDFGLAKICTNKESIISMLGARGTPGYIAPEVFCRNIGEVSHKSDVYSYGMMVLEMVGGRKNINVRADHTSEIYFPHWIYQRIELDEELGLRGISNERDREMARKMTVVSLWCIQTCPLNRPPMSKVLDMLEGSIESLQIPPKPFLSSPPRATADSSTSVSAI